MNTEKKTLLGDAFWANNHKVLANSMVSFTLYLYNFFQGREKHMKKLLCINNTPQQTFVLVKNYWRRLEVVFRVKCFCLEDVFSVTFFCLSRRLQDIIARRLLENVLKTSWRRHLEDVFGRHLGRQKNCYADDVLENKKCLLGLWDFQTARFIGF